MKKIAVFFGGKSYEHDISILTGLQVCKVMDITKHEPIPVYVNKVGRLFTGKQLLDPKFYPILEFREAQLTEVILPVGETYPVLQNRFGFIKKKTPFDIAFLAFHGADGESGGWQGLLESAGIPYTGADIKSSAVYMDKSLTKSVCRTLEIKVLDETIIQRPTAEFYDVKKLLANFRMEFPIMAKPRSLGSSVGIHKCTNMDELSAACIDIFNLGDDVLCEPFVENLVEYNIAVMRDRTGQIVTSAIERPNASGDTLSFADKYLGNGKKKAAKKKGISILPSQALIESRREFNPHITSEQESFIRNSAEKLFANMGATGNPRIDFIGNKATGEIWMNEVNPIPGAFAFYLWAQAKPSVNYTELVTTIIENANWKMRNIDLKAAQSVLFK
jgi:D-alanine-D-alanine ligase